MLTRRRAREDQQLFIAEGVRLIEEGLTSGQIPRHVLYSEPMTERVSAIVKAAATKGSEVEQVRPEILASLSDTETSQGVLAVYPWIALPLLPDMNFVFVLDAVRDPGNLGTILRSADAAGVQAVFLAPGTTDPYSPKVVRAGMGAHFHLPMRELDWVQIENIGRQQIQPPLRFLLTDSKGGVPVWDQDLQKPVAFIIGGEAEGAGEHARRLADDRVTIPIPGRAESLNAAISASILMFETIRQRSR